ncbi:MAG: CRISPR-associated protein Cas4 [Anaerolineae bacterium]|nr:CRISPR-associated protein Cas4 [Anaerolineae bacterium]
MLVIRSRAARQQAGLPKGRVTYVDTGAWNRCERPLFSNRYRLTGRPDYIVRLREGVVPVEVKSSRAPAQPYESHLMQLAAYCLLLEEMEGRVPPYGILKYRDRTFEVDYTPDLRARLLVAVEEMRSGLGDQGPARSHDEPPRCRGCGHRSQCDQRLA